jgi:hypothetical protein
MTAKISNLPQASQISNLILWLVGAYLLGLFYLAVAAWGFGYSGFPLDDAWIHQTYARNLARSGQLAFIPGVPSAGSTAPLWSLLLSLGYLLGIPFQIWTYGLGMTFLGLTGWTVARLGTHLFPEQPRVSLWAGLFCLFEWHLIWAAVSGMETILFVWLSLFLVERYTQSKIHARQTGSPKSKMEDFGLGLLGGLLVLTRPEGLVLVGLIGLDMAYCWWQQERELKADEVARRGQDPLWEGTKGALTSPSVSLSLRLGSDQGSPQFPFFRRWLWLTAGVGLLLAPYVAFHLWNTGLPFPNTFYAKQAEYQVILKAFPLWWRLFGNFGEPVETVQGVFRVIFIGAQFLLLPGLLFAAWLTLVERRTELGLIWLWWVGYLLLYGFRLPVTYQHGRYQIPAIPWVILLGVWGTACLLEKIPRRNVALRVVRQALALSLIMLTLAFTVIGAQAYGQDVRFIESEMVATAHWLRANVPPDALIAVHDIGAIGYFTQRPLIDLAGLITPEIIPIIRDETALFAFITGVQADYLVTFPSWYPQMSQNARLTPLYQTDAPWTRQAGGDNMVVYRINR